MDHFAILCNSYFAIKNICAYKQVFVDDFYAVCTDFCSDILVVEFDFLHLWRSISVSAVCDTISTEVIVCRTFSEVTAVCLEFFAVAVFFVDRLVNIVPDKSALILRFCVCQICIFVHCTAGISHCMGVFTADKRLGAVFCKELFDCLYGWIHLTFHVTGIVISAVMAETFIMNQASRIFLVEEL